MENGIEENNQQQLLDALKALRECKNVNTLTNEQRNTLTNASTEDLCEAYVQIDTFDVDKCCSFENPYCAYGLCCTGALTTATLYSTLLPMLCGPITPYEGEFLTWRGISAIFGGISGIFLLPIAEGVDALATYYELEKEKRDLANNTHLISRSNYFLPILKKIISFHSYSETDRNNIKQTITNLCRRRLILQMGLPENYDASTACSDNNNSTISIDSVNNVIVQNDQL